MEVARNFLQWLIHESPPAELHPKVVTASDNEVEVAGEAFIQQYKEALERLASRLV